MQDLPQKREKKSVFIVEAKEMGLVNWVFAAEELEEAVDKLVEKFKEKSSVVLESIRMAVYQGLNKDFKEALDGVTTIYLDRLIKTKDAVEGLKAFSEKRKPVWKEK